MQQGLLNDAMQDPTMSQPQGAMGGMSDVDMAVEDAMMGGAMQDVGMGVEMASEEEHQILQTIMDEIEKNLHGDLSQDIINILKTEQSVQNSIAMASHSLIMGSFSAASRGGLEDAADIYIAENGVIQETVELVFEMAEAMGKVSADDDETLAAAYMNTLRKVGETLLGSDDPEIRESAQELLVEMETGVPVGPSDYMEGDEMAMMGQPTDPMAQMAQGASQAPSEAPLPPMAPNQGMI